MASSRAAAQVAKSVTRMGRTVGMEVGLTHRFTPDGERISWIRMNPVEGIERFFKNVENRGEENCQSLSVGSIELDVDIKLYLCPSLGLAWLEKRDTHPSLLQLTLTFERRNRVKKIPQDLFLVERWRKAVETAGPTCISLIYIPSAGREFKAVVVGPPSYVGVLSNYESWASGEKLIRLSKC